MLAEAVSEGFQSINEAPVVAPARNACFETSSLQAPWHFSGVWICCFVILVTGPDVVIAAPPFILPSPAANVDSKPRRLVHNNKGSGGGLPGSHRPPVDILSPPQATPPCPSAPETSGFKILGKSRQTVQSRFWYGRDGRRKGCDGGDEFLLALGR